MTFAYTFFYFRTKNSVGGPGGNRKVSGNADLALAAGYVVVSPGCRGRDNKAADGTWYGKAPAAIADLKAAVRYQPEPSLFGNPATGARHFTNFSLRQSTGNMNAEVEGSLKNLVSMMNAMYFIGQDNSDCAQHWWIRHGTSDNHTSQTVIVKIRKISSPGLARSPVSPIAVDLGISFGLRIIFSRNTIS